MLPSDHELFRIARVLKSNGTDGEVVLNFRDIDPEDIDIKEPVFIHFGGMPVPFFIESFARKGKNKALVRLTGIRSLEDADEIAGQDVYVDMDSLDMDYEPEEDLSFIVGWTLYNAILPEGAEVGQGAEARLEEVGTISDFLDIPSNPCIEVDTKNGAVTIPLHDNLIHSIDPDSGSIAMYIPAGLL